jgi:small subunit ribosomal protein S14
MARLGLIETNKRKAKLIESQKSKRQLLKNKIMDKETSSEDRFVAQLLLASMPRNGAKNRYRNRCALTGRPRAYYRKFGLARNAFRECAHAGLIPGVKKSSW